MSSFKLLASTSRLASKQTGCSCPATALRSFSSSAVVGSASDLPPPLPLHAHPNSTSPQPVPEGSPSPLALLASQPSHYISALLLGRRYLLTPNDILTVPKLKGVSLGDRISLTRILEVGSRDYTLRATPSGPSHRARAIADANNAPLLTPASARSLTKDGVPRDWQRHPDSLPYLGEETVKAELTVLEHTKGSMFEVEKFKRRKGYRRTLRSKLGFTKLRVGDIVLGSE